MPNQDLQKTRTETDLLGSLEVPVEAYYGIHTVRAINNFPISRTTINDYPEFIRGMAQVKKATAIANNQLKTLPVEKARPIIWACDQIIEHGRCLDQFPINAFQGGAGTSLNMNANEVIANLALEYLGEEKGAYGVINPNDDVNMAQSTNDAYPTGLKLGIHARFQPLLLAITEIVAALETKGEEFQDVLKMGRTQLQDAVPMSLGAEFKGFAHTLGKDIELLKSAADALLEVNLGATAIGTGLNTPTGFVAAVTAALAEVTGLPITSAPDLIEATSDCGGYVHAHGVLKRFALKLSKICNDLRLLSSGPTAGLGEINLPERQAGSSIMPGKVNPVIPEVVNQVCFKIMGNDVTVSAAAEAGQLQLNVMEPVIAQAIFESLEILTNALNILREYCIDGITANIEVCEQYVRNSIGTVTYLNPFIGHSWGDRIAREALQTGKAVTELVLEKGLLPESQLAEVMDKHNLMYPSFNGITFPDDPGL
ncbi:aspartate ammonia-lyase [Corynebacterium caspium]|uniref:aspartate ammonia-lyase n=1 Tax=Corynebacterium caspium TaxID=234828 RepID=UPI0003616E73|nr:aspartate ammonia-lyase [Corynebacterium caspium]WKD59289.1 Aspartate ammonia-lyase [Corynebacterium caspium DSM 44850]